jgi:phosphoribosyl 1,2-cyclic phosphate phosphodiesterase
MRVTFLGTGTSVGVPRIGCDCSVCRSPDPRNQRLRCSLLVEHRDRAILVDTTPDLRTQALRQGLQRLDAVLFTHAHADHLHGLDDVRCFCLDRSEPLPCYADARTRERIEVVFDYAFQDDHLSSVPQIVLRPAEEEFELWGLRVQPIPVLHGRLPILGFRLGPFAYVTDCSAIPAPSMARLRGVEILVLDALRYREHPTHFNVDQALSAIAALKPRQAWLTHLAHDLDHEPADAKLPPSVRLAYDGLILDLP